MTSVAADRRKHEQRARLLAWLTIVWNAAEGVAAVGAGAAAGSVALVGFGLDSFVEVFSGTVVLWQLAGVREDRDRRALRMIGVSFYLLAAYVVVDAVRDLIAGSEAGESGFGIALAVVSLAVMQFLVVAKRRTGTALHNHVVLADAQETALCMYLSVVLLAGLALNAAFGWWWADPLAALVIAGLAIKEGREAWNGDACCTPAH
jgi:divalent metal cation (Fe/Co/Zn/Cd) transporter